MLLRSIADVSANETIWKLLKQLLNGHCSDQIPKRFSYSCILTRRCIEPAAIDLKLPIRYSYIYQAGE